MNFFTLLKPSFWASTGAQPEQHLYTNFIICSKSCILDHIQRRWVVERASIREFFMLRSVPIFSTDTCRSKANPLILLLNAKCVSSPYEIKIVCSTCTKVHIFYFGEDHVWNRYSAQIVCMSSDNKRISSLGASHVSIPYSAYISCRSGSPTRYFYYRNSWMEHIYSTDKLQVQHQYTN
jgi:hypothetical protein